ncbi:MAG TPA: putative baseplate assembly protein [Solirubrobacteraceae bacterium]|nr:putative baseplate assembly protein [Solirubrobacteraceae bacterium]
MNRLPQITLDDRRFQELVSEARMRIARTSPEWTEHNVSDPGITLIELFAWMTDMLVYRLNRVPDKLHVALLELLGIRLHGPTAARTSVRFRLAAVPQEPVEIPAGATEVGTLRTASEESIVFQVSDAFRIAPVRPTAYVVARAEQVQPIAIADGTARPQGGDRLPFATPPQPGDALYLGFDAPISSLLMRVEIDSSLARGVGVDPERPPLRWEISDGDGGWAQAEVLSDDTGGFNYGKGAVELQCPDRSGIAAVGTQRLRWLRCRIVEPSPEAGGAYSQPPEVYAISAAPIGALVGVEHAARAREEWLGRSDGTPGQVFPLRFSPVLALTEAERLEVRSPGSERWAQWTEVESFAASGPEDPHFTLDRASGQIELGPAVRQPDGGWTQYGAIPAQGAELRISGYRHGGGRRGNVAAGTLTVLRNGLAGVASVTNPKPAYGGVDSESLDSARQRAALEIRTRYRAVTAEDFEFLVSQSSSRVGRTICRAPSRPTDSIKVHVLPRVAPADRHLTLDELTPDAGLLAEVASYLDGRRVIGMTVDLLPVRLRGISVVVNLQAHPGASLQRVEEEVLQALYTYINPLVGGAPTGPGTGWPFGRLLNQGELYQIVHSVDGVEFVKILRVYETDLRTGEQAPQPAGSHVMLEADELLASARHVVRAVHAEIVG